MEYLIGLVVGIFLTMFLGGVILLARAGSLGRASWGLTLAGRANIDPAFANKVNELIGLPITPLPTNVVPPTTKTASAPTIKTIEKPSGAPLRLLAILQTESRILDFLLEDIASFEDAQIGQAVRDIHRKAQAAIKQHLVLEPIVAGSEGDAVTVPVGFDPAAIRVLGNVTGKPPFTGQVQHPGWRVRELKLTPLALGQDEFIVQPAEVHLG